MSFSQSIFQKNLYDITREDLENFFSEPQEESAILEFKEGGTDLKKIHSEIAAFLNTEGGVLILGAPREVEHPSKKNYKQASGVLTPCPVKDRDVIMRSIGSNIVPSPTTIKIQAIEIEGGSVYILEIGQSMHPPHQVSDSGKYYVRMERETKAAPHGFVEALFFKRQKPKIDVRVKAKRNGGNKIESDENMKVSFTLSNSSPVTAENWGYIINFIGITYCNNDDDPKKITVEGESAKTVNFHANSILVKGLSLTFNIDVRASAFQFIIEATFYGKDVEASTTYYTVDHDGTVKICFEEGTERANLAFQQLLKEYSDKFFAEILPKLKSLSTEARIPAKANVPLVEYYEKQGVSIPPSYLRFFKYLDGFDGYIGNLRCVFWGITKLTHPSESESYVESATRYQIMIGHVELNDIFLYRDDDRIDFRIFLRNGVGHVIGMKPIARSFVWLLAKIERAGNLSMLLADLIDEK